jgi:hypothetical protein
LTPPSHASAFIGAPGIRSRRAASDADAVVAERLGFEWRRKRVAGEHLGASLYALPPGQATFPYHYELGNDELLVVVAARHCCVQPKVSGRSSQAIAFFSQAERRALTK